MTTRNTNVLTAIMQSAPVHTAIKSTMPGMDKDTLSAWKGHTHSLTVAIARYSSALDVTNTADDRSALVAARQDVYSALIAAKDFSGLDFPNGTNEPELLLERLVTVKALKNDEGEFLTSAVILKSEQTARREIEFWLYQRQTGAIGITAEEYMQAKAEQKARKDAMRKEKGKFAKWAKDGVNSLTDEQIKSVWEKCISDEKSPEEVQTEARSLVKALYNKVA